MPNLISFLSKQTSRFLLKLSSKSDPFIMSSIRSEARSIKTTVVFNHIGIFWIWFSQTFVKLECFNWR